MPDQKGIASGRAQIALEFVIVYSFVLVLFVLMFTLISTQRAATMSQQEYSLLQLQSQNIADYIDQAIGAGSGYAATIPLAGSIGAQQFNISISTTGVVIAQTKVGSQIIRAFAFSNARNLLINGTPTQSGNGITVYLVPIQSGSVSLANSNGAIYVDQQPPPTLRAGQGKRSPFTLRALHRLTLSLVGVSAVADVQIQPADVTRHSDQPPSVGNRLWPGHAPPSTTGA